MDKFLDENEFRKVLDKNMGAFEGGAVFKVIKERGREEGLEEGLKKGKQEGLKKGRQEGLKKAKETAKNLLNLGIEPGKIAKATGFSIEQVLAL